ncbi:hypothetical protein L861_06955 [Litchfieldella anticariensis FP35 = DSM 16096]|uniref:Uncharacterized protein n=1 Tax=Litchfieldella anticariensis (strain DSM 16096 / CECT 5854 / CIP 108499 / LMG 22089 / FP35) TaxID=1121939 RepID=S2L659_LITA3|nr:hypothetical protein [Halomonas anticariensis]EPC00226.1 hypothetical protein L861_06955 [Halomonas anticariensis FP35 = DSM 16096]
MSGELSEHKACEDQKLFIQVMGKEHPEGHRFVFYDRTDQQEQEALTARVEEEDLPEPLSRIHGWTWKDQPERNVWLEIASEEGAPIRVPLFRRVQQTPWQEHPQRTVWQHHVVQPVMPLALWQSLLDGNKHALPARPGYLYVHYQGAIWREIEIAMSESGQWEFRDVDLAQHRDNAGEYADNHRPSVGKPLVEIWLPARQDLSWLSSEVKVAFSDVQWSAPRLNYLEANPTVLNQRFQSVSLQAPAQTVSSGRLLAAEQLSAQRERCPGLEWQIAHPPLWTEDLTGQAVTSRYAEIETEQQQLDAGGPEAVNVAWNNAKKPDSPSRLEAGLRAAAAEAITQSHRDTAASGASDGEENTPLPWKDAPAGSDVFEDARQRQIPGLVIDDPMFELRHALVQTQQSQGYLSALLERCASRPHYRSAIMVQKRLMPERIGDQDNPLHEFADGEVLGYRAGKFHTAVATLARDIAHDLWEAHQTRLADYLGDASYQRVLADYFSLEGGDYLSGFEIAQQCFTALSLDPQRADTLLNQDIANQFGRSHARAAQRTLLALLEDGSREPLHAMCFPDSETYPVEQPFSLPEEEANDGSGTFRPLALANESQRSQPPASDELYTLEVSILAAMARTSATGELKRWTNALDTLFGKIAESGNNLLAQVADESQRTAMAARLYLPSFNASRGALHALIGDLTFQPLGSVDMSRKVLLGVEDVASGLTFGLDKAEREYLARNNQRQFYGEVYRTQDNKLLGGTNKQRLRSMQEVGEAREVRFVFADADSQAAKMVRRGRTQIGWAERGAEVIKLPYILVVAEAMNLWQSLPALRELELKTGVSLAAAVVDLTLATLNLSDYIAKRHQAPRPIVYVSEISQKVLIRNSQTNIVSRLFPSLIRVNWSVTKASGLLLAISMTWEAVGRFDEGDTDAGIAFAAAAIGATLLMVFSGPVGWIGLALLLGGSISGIWLTDGPVEQWLKHGPFGDQRDDAPWLLDPEEAYYRLQSLLANIQVSIRRVSPVERDALLARLGQTHDRPSGTTSPLGRLWQAQPNLQQGINTAIEVRSALPGMGVELQDVAALSLVRGERSVSPAGSIWERRSSTRVPPLLTQLASHCITYFVHTPKSERVYGFGSGDVYRWDIQLQFRETTRPPLLPNRRIFPAPPPLEEMPSDMTEVLSLEDATDDYWIKETLDVS